MSDEVATESSGGAGMADAIDHHAMAMGERAGAKTVHAETDPGHRRPAAGPAAASSAAKGSEGRARPSDAVAKESSRGAGEYDPLQVSREEFARRFFTKREDVLRFLHRNNVLNSEMQKELAVRFMLFSSKLDANTPLPHPSGIRGNLPAPSPAPSADPLLQLPWREGTVDCAVVCELVRQYPDAAHQRNQRGNTALHLAVENRASCSVVEGLLAANPEAASIANEDGWRYAAAKVCKMLIFLPCK